MPTFYGDRKKCYKCYRPESSCMCEHINAFDTNTKFVILMHPKEFKKVKNNTGHFTHRSLSNSELFVGVDFSNHKRINEIIQTHESYILFPSEHSINITHNNPKNESQNNLAIFIIDSTWGCTNKIFKKSDNLKQLSHISFVSSKVSQYQIKEQPQSNYLSTIESTLVVLEDLNNWGIEDIKEKSLEGFLNPFFKMISYQQDKLSTVSSNSVRFKSYS